jgi:hypothetical protein
MENTNEILENVRYELLRALKEHGDFNSCHEGFAVLLEEVDELWEEVKKKSSLRDIGKMYEESIQIAAMAVKFAQFVRKDIKPYVTQ